MEGYSHGGIHSCWKGFRNDDEVGLCRSVGLHFGDVGRGVIIDNHDEGAKRKHGSACRIKSLGVARDRITLRN